MEGSTELKYPLMSVGLDRRSSHIRTQKKANSAAAFSSLFVPVPHRHGDLV